MTAEAITERAPGWLVDQLPPLLALATALTGSAGTAADLVADALTRDSAALRRLGDLDFPEDQLRALVVQQYLSRRHRSAGPGPDAAAGLFGGLDALPPLARAAVVLRDGLHLTGPEIGSVLDRPAAQLATDLAAADDAYGTEVAGLFAAAPAPDAVLARLGRADRRARLRRGRAVAVGAVVAVLVAAAVAVPTVLLPRLPAQVRTAGDWRYSHDVRLGDGWAVSSRVLTPTIELTELQPPRPTGDPVSCWIRVYTEGAYPGSAAEQVARTTVHGRPGYFGEDRADGPYLAWEYGRNAWARANCTSSPLDEAELLGVASSVRFRPSPAKLPFALSEIPEGYRVLGLTEYPQTEITEMQLAKGDIEPGEVNLVLTAPLDQFRGNTSRGRPVEIDGRPGRVVGGSEPRMCVEDNDRALCVLTYWPGGNWPAPAPDPVRAEPLLRDLAATLRLAPDLRDPETWFDARVALPD